MSSDALIGLAGVAVGSGLSLFSVYLSQNLTEKREKLKALVAREEEAISEIYSPLVFILEKSRDIFARVLALKDTYGLLSEAKIEINDVSPPFFQYLFIKEAAKYPKMLEDILLHKAGLAEPAFYIDLIELQSYLSTIVSFLENLIAKAEKPEKLQKHVSSFGPLIRELDEALGRMRTYSISKVARSKAEYTPFFDDKKFSELEGYVDAINKSLTGEDVLDWKRNLDRLNKK